MNLETSVALSLTSLHSLRLLALQTVDFAALWINHSLDVHQPGPCILLTFPVCYNLLRLGSVISRHQVSAAAAAAGYMVALWIINPGNCLHGASENAVLITAKVCMQLPFVLHSNECCHSSTPQHAKISSHADGLTSSTLDCAAFLHFADVLLVHQARDTARLSPHASPSNFGGTSDFHEPRALCLPWAQTK